MIVGDHIIPGYVILALALLVFVGVGRVPWFADHRFTRRLIRTVCVLFALYGLDRTIYPTEAANIRVTVSVDDNGREVHGSSVWRVVVWRLPFIPESIRGIETESYGNAVIVDLGGKGKLFALLRSGRDQYYGVKDLPYSIFRAHLDPTWSRPLPKLGEPTRFDRVNSLGAAGRIEYRPGDEELFAPETKKGEIPGSKVRPDGSRANYVFPPKLVMFRDIRDHNTLTVVDPTNLAAVFGAGVKLKSITAEPTQDARTQNGIETIVPIPSPRYEPPNAGSDLSQRHWELRVDRFKGDFP